MGVRKFDQIDGLRFFAVFAVVCAHWHSSLSNFFGLITAASRGVDLFFVISGFLITLGLIRSKEKNDTKGSSLYKFYIRRFLRIFPIYYLTVFILLYFNYNQISDSIWWFLLYASNFHSIKIQDWGAAGHLWSLSVEEQFYLVWPFIILFIPDRKLPAVIIAAVLLSLTAKSYWVVTNAPFWSLYMHPLAALDTLALGAMLAYLYYFHTDQLRKMLYNPGIPGHILSSRPLKYIGKISYAIYLFHPFVPVILSRFKYPENENLRFVLYAAVTVGLASASWHLFESRILKLKDRFE